jgi:hypothetical protein
MDLHHSWIGLSLCRSVAGGRLIQLWPFALYYGFHFTLMVSSDSDRMAQSVDLISA